jgi:probable HAF family extracellular repeat protein
MRCAVVSALAMASIAARANHYTLVDLGPAVAEPRINDAGDVTGYVDREFGLTERAMLWHAGHWRKLAKTWSEAHAINANGDVVGIVGDEEKPLPVIWRAHQDAQVLTQDEGRANGINDSGVVVGALASDVSETCFEWTEEGGFVDLGFMKRGEGCEAYAINRRGQITGSADTKGYLYTKAFRWYQGVFEDLGSLGHGGSVDVFARGLAINDDGDVAGFSEVSPADLHQYHAILWRGTTLIDLDPGSAYKVTEALGINDRGDIVGWGTGYGKDNVMRAMRFTNPGIVELDTEVDNLGRWHVLEATGVNRKGDIAGQAVGPAGVAHVVVLQLRSTD